MSAPVMSDSVWLRSKLVRLTKLAITPAASSTSWSVTGKCASEAAVGVSCIDLVLIAVFAWVAAQHLLPRLAGAVNYRCRWPRHCHASRSAAMTSAADTMRANSPLRLAKVIAWIFSAEWVSPGSYPVERPRRVAHQSRVKSEIAGHPGGGFHAMVCRRAADHQRFDAGRALPG